MDSVAGRRWVMLAAGGAAGAAIRLSHDLTTGGLLPDRAGTALMMLMAGIALAFLALSGPLSPRRAAGGALVVGTVAAALFLLSDLRYPPGEALDGGLRAVLAFAATVLLAVPPWIARARGDWRDYGTLFREGWGMVIRAASALAFLGLAWAVIALSDALLKLVGLELLDPLWNRPVLAWGLSGAVIGLALAVMEEWQARTTPGLALRLVRLLLPAVLTVILVFLAALPMRGLSGLVGDFSAAGALLAMCAAAIVLVTLALAEGDAEAVAARPMRLSAWLLAAILVLPAGLAAWSVAIRVGDYGWTPQRMVAATGAGLALVVGLVWLAALLRGAGWAGRIRAANMWLGAGVLALAALWQTPLLNAEAISARSQAARIQAGAGPDIATLRRFGEWGRPGAALLARLEEGAEGDLALSLQQLRGAAEAITAEGFADLVPVRPVEAEAEGRAILEAMVPDERARWAAICRNRLDGDRPGCALVVGAFHPENPAAQAILIGNGAQGAELTGFYLSGGRLRTTWVDGSSAGDEVLRRVLQGEFAIEPVPENRLSIGGRSLNLGQ